MAVLKVVGKGRSGVKATNNWNGELDHILLLQLSCKFNHILIASR